MIQQYFSGGSLYPAAPYPLANILRQLTAAATKLAGRGRYEGSPVFLIDSFFME
jgi:hypothetical protein